MKGTLKYFILAAALFWCCSQASAQRTMPGRFSVAVNGCFNGSSVSAEAFFGQYTLGGYWEAGLLANDYGWPLSVSGRLQYDQLAVAGGYQFRLAATRDRAVNLYGGGGVFAGLEFVDPFRSLPEYYVLPIDSQAFLYGLYVKTTAEFFIGRCFAFVLEASLPLAFSSQLSMINYAVGGGIKLIL